MIALSRMLDKIDAAANPVLLRDLRLYGRGRGMIGAYFLTLAILVIAGVTYALAARWGGLGGGGLLYIPTVLMALIVGALTPNLVGERFRTELESRSSELALASPLTAGRMVRGKIYGAWILAFVIVATAAPVFATAYLLGGVTLRGVAGIAAGLLLAGFVMPMPQLYLATKGRRQGGGRILAGVVFVGNLLLMYGYASLLYHTFADFSPGMFTEEILFLTALAAAGVLYGQFLYFVTVSRLRPAATNRELWPRLSLIAGMAAGGLAALGIAHLLSAHSSFMRGSNQGDLILLAATITAFAFCEGMLLISHDNGAEPLRAPDDKRGILSRALFSTGLGSLSLYFTVCGAALLACGLFPALTAADRYAITEELPPLLLAPFVAFATGLSVYSWLVRPFFKKQDTPGALPTAIIVVNIVVALLAAFAMVLVKELDAGEVTKAIVYGSNFVGLLLVTFESSYEIQNACAVAVILLAALMLAQIPFMLKRGRSKPGAGQK